MASSQMRLTGLMSGMDTESIISQLVSARKTKVDTVKKAQTKLSWQQDAWKELNTKLKNLQQKFISNMRFTDAYTKKTTDVSNSSVVSVLTGDNAINGTQELTVDELAKTHYLTGGTIKGADGGKLTALSKMSDLGVDFKGQDTATFKFKPANGGDEKTITVTENSTISDVLNQLKSAGVNASFDEKQQRLFVSAKNTGEKYNFDLVDDGDEAGSSVLSKLGLTENAGLKTITGQDAQITLNGAVFKSENNVFEVNGLTLNAIAKSAPGETVSITTRQDTDGIYDMIKNFLKEYNEVINEMDKLYNAESSKGYEPLTDEEKESMSEKEIEKYEQKIKDSLFRRDSNLSTISSSLKEIMSSGFNVNGKKMYLFDFGIETLGYFNAPDNEKNAYHIAGDPDDANTSGSADKLKQMIASDPNTVIDFMTQLSNKLYDKMFEMSKSVDGYRSFGNFYDDKKMKSDYTDYTSKIKEMEQKLNDYEDKWYKKFAKMETAMSKMQSNTSAVTALIGG